MESVLGGFLAKNRLHFGMVSIEKRIGEKIRKLRRSKIPEITIEQLAEMSGLTRQTVGAVEKGNLPKVSIGTILKIANALNVSIDELTGDAHLFIDKAAEEPERYKKKN